MARRPLGLAPDHLKRVDWESQTTMENTNMLFTKPLICHACGGVLVTYTSGTVYHTNEQCITHLKQELDALYELIERLQEESHR